MSDRHCRDTRAAVRGKERCFQGRTKQPQTQCKASRRENIAAFKLCKAGRRENIAAFKAMQSWQYFCSISEVFPLEKRRKVENSL